MSAVATIPAALTGEQIAEFIENPLKQVPYEWRALVWDFWAFFSHLMPTQLTLCTRIRHWIEDEKLTQDELRATFSVLRKPDRSASFKFPSELLAAIGEEIHTARRVKRDSVFEKMEYDRIHNTKRELAEGLVSNLSEAFNSDLASPIRFK